MGQAAKRPLIRPFGAPSPTGGRLLFFLLSRKNNVTLRLLLFPLRCKSDK